LPPARPENVISHSHLPGGQQANKHFAYFNLKRILRLQIS